MFNTYQELVDRIEELLKERKQQEKLIKKLKNMYLKIPLQYINELTMRQILTETERAYWIKLKLAQRKEQQNVSNNNQN